jgi:hypothetical protein
VCGWRRRRRRNSDVSPQLFKPLRAHPADCEKVFDAPKSAALLAHVDDPLSDHRSHTGQFLELLDGGGVEVDWLCWGLFLCAQDSAQQNQRQPCREDFDREISGTNHGYIKEHRMKILCGNLDFRRYCSARLQAGTADSSTCSSAAADERYRTRPRVATQTLNRVLPKSDSLAHRILPSCRTRQLALRYLRDRRRLQSGRWRSRSISAPHRAHRRP